MALVYHRVQTLSSASSEFQPIQFHSTNEKLLNESLFMQLFKISANNFIVVSTQIVQTLKIKCTYSMLLMQFLIYNGVYSKWDSKCMEIFKNLFEIQNIQKSPTSIP